MATQNSINNATKSGSNTFIGWGAGNTTFSGAIGNIAIGIGPLDLVTSGDHNIAIGNSALDAITTNSRNVGIGETSLGACTSDDNSCIGHNSGSAITTGSQNTSLGAFSTIVINTGSENTAVGYNCMRKPGASSFNTCVGWNSLGNASGECTYNTAIGYVALLNSTTASQCTLIGARAGDAISTGLGNVGVGYSALGSLTTGTTNIGIGHNAGLSLTTSDSNNICIGNSGVSGDSGEIRIGTSGTHNKTFIQAIRGVTTDNADAVAVLIDSAGQLGQTSSSLRYKENIEDIDERSQDILKLRPVSFTYKDRSSRKLEYGFIAEEVAEYYPDLIVHDEDGEIDTIQYHKLYALMINEIQRNRKMIDDQQIAIQDLLNRIG